MRSRPRPSRERRALSGLAVLSLALTLLATANLDAAPDRTPAARRTPSVVPPPAKAPVARAPSTVRKTVERSTAFELTLKDGRKVEGRTVRRVDSDRVSVTTTDGKTIMLRDTEIARHTGKLGRFFDGSAKRPGRHALLVLLENDGMGSVVGQLQGLGGADLPELPYIVYEKDGHSLELKINKNESIAQAIARLTGTITKMAEEAAGKPPTAPVAPLFPSPPAPPNTPNPLDPSYVKALELYTSDLAKWTARVSTITKNFLDPSNWKVKTMSMTEALDAVSDFLLEELTKGIQLAQTPGAYDKVVILEDAQVTAPKVLAKIRELAPSYVLDIHVLTHGGTDTIYGYNSGSTHHVLTPHNFFEPLRADRESGRTPLFLRAVYQMNCSSGTLKDDWIDLGAEVVNGTEGDTLNYMPHQYFHFMDRWVRRKQTFEQASLGSHDDTKDATELVYQVFLANHQGRVAGSRLTVVGDGSIRRTSP